MQAETRVYFTWSEVEKILIREAKKESRFGEGACEFRVAKGPIEPRSYVFVVGPSAEPKKEQNP